jgi:hypothetical protein
VGGWGGETMKKVTKIKRSPSIVQEIKNEGCEPIYWIGNSAFIHYEDEEGVFDKKHTISTDGKFYREVGSSDHPGAVRISTVSPDFTVVIHCYEPIEEKP